MAEEPGRLLGLDVGDRRIGVAISDPARRLAVPLRSILRDRRGSEIDEIAALVKTEAVTEVVAGLPLSLSGESGAQAEATRRFAAELERRLGLNVRFWDERLSTREAERLAQPRGEGRRERRGRRASTVDTDALAASIILQAYLDSLPRADACP